MSPCRCAGAVPVCKTMPSRPIPLRALVLLALLTLVWGTNWPLFPFAMAELSVWTFRALSVPAAGLLLLAVARARGQSLTIARRHWPAVGAATVCYLFVWNIAGTYAALLLPSGQAAVLGFTMPLWAALIGWAVLGERFTARLLAALALGVLAVVLLMVPSFAAYAGAPWGLAGGLAAGIGWAVGTLILKRHDPGVPVTVLTGWQFLFIGIPITLGALALGDHRWFMPSWTTIGVIAYITLVPMGAGTVAWFAIVGLLPATLAGLSAVMVPVVAMITGAIVHGEPLGATQWLAIVCCVASLSLVMLAPGARGPGRGPGRGPDGPAR
jgi:drug/metabolite transporter (DMT)-like permease